MARRQSCIEGVVVSGFLHQLAPDAKCRRVESHNLKCLQDIVEPCSILAAFAASRPRVTSMPIWISPMLTRRKEQSDER